MLTESQTALIKATVPLLETGGEALTRHFYQTMLGEYPEVRPLFNQAHQASGAQARALANAVLMYARHIDRLEALGPLVGQIVNKHVALQVQAEHYPIVGTCLLRAIREVLGEAVATDAVIDAWAAAYQQLADLLIGAEAEVYDALAAAPGGWRGGRAFRVVSKTAESSVITSFELEPVDGGPVVNFEPGQYIGLRVEIVGIEVRRNYSLSQAPNGRRYRISVKRESEGLVSGYLHDHLAVGGTIELFPPAGDFTLAEAGSAAAVETNVGPGAEPRPLVLISGGVGITPTLAMAEATLARGERPVIFIHYARNGQVQGFAEQLEAWRERFPQFRAHVVHEQPPQAGERAPDEIGRPAAAHFERWLPADRDVDAYLLGPAPFMGFVRRTLKAVGVADPRIRHEFFGPAQALD